MTLKEFPSNPTFHGFCPPSPGLLFPSPRSYPTKPPGFSSCWPQHSPELSAYVFSILLHSLSLCVTNDFPNGSLSTAPSSSLEQVLLSYLSPSLSPPPTSFTMWHWLTWNYSRSGSSRTCDNQFSCPCLLRTDPKPAPTHPAFSPPSCHRSYFYLSFRTIVYIAIL